MFVEPYECRSCSITWYSQISFYIRGEKSGITCCVQISTPCKGHVSRIHQRLLMFLSAAFCLCQVWEAISWSSSLWEERTCLLWDSLPPGMYHSKENSLKQWFCYEQWQWATKWPGSKISEPLLIYHPFVADINIYWHNSTVSCIELESLQVL